ncbi:cell surface glycoprotein 1 isoform X2 [Brienomyrus brachyistius]|nr:cell surface glycoprotein 1 isoform X2 [Brienomyrus brachyistius]XP_048845346.1 cell surface glycoprotein 1 isoform X2 [Brienomyrus brachyistius]XP_048845347.1 cell surface glycoprotein 1 isoform X2 [Brienomyrus brachyistius]
MKRTNGGKLIEGCSHPQNPTAEDQEYFSEAVTIETSHLSGMGTVTDNNMDSMVTEMAENNGLLVEGEKVGIQADVMQPIKTEESVGPSEGPPRDKDEIAVLEDLENGDQESVRDISCHKEALVLEAGQEEFNRTETMTSSVSDSPSNTGSVCENKLTCKSQNQIDHNKRDSPLTTDEKVSSVPTEERHSLIYTEKMDSPIPKEEKESPITKEEKDSNVSNEKKESHIPKEKDSNIPSEKNDSPIPNEKKESPITKEEKDSNVSNEKKESPIPKEKDSNIPSEKNDSPIPNEKKESLIPKEEKDSNIPREKNDSPIPNEKKESPIPKEEKDSNITNEKKESLIPKEEKDCPIPKEANDNPISKEEKYKPLPNEEKESPIAKEEKENPIPKEEKDKPLPSEEKESPIAKKEKENPIPKEEKDKPLPSEEKESPIAKKEKENPIPKEEKDKPLPSEEKESPIAKEEKESPIAKEEKDSALPTEESNNPISKVERDTPIPKEEMNSPVLTGDAEDNVVPEISQKAVDGCEGHGVTQHNATQEEKEEPILQMCLREDNLSEISNESCHNLDQDDLSDCLQVEIAIVSSDSESDDKWRAIFSSSINKEEENDVYLDNSKDTNAQEHFVQEVASVEDALTEPEQENEAQLQDSASILEQPESYSGYDLETQEDPCHFSTQSQGLSKMSEDKEQVAPNLVKHRTYTINPARSSTDKKIPSDYCVIQETKSENVSTEHVDFRVARKQWLKMEEQTKQQALQPTVKQGSCQGGHSLMYTPVRNIEKPKKDMELDSLALRELTFTQFSPCSEDSGLDDSSYRSPYDEPETPIEREIRLAMEREENFRRERGLPTSPSANIRPATLFMGKFNKPEERRKTPDLQEDSCRPLRSPSIKTPPISVSTSSSLKSPTYHEMTANNVIILEPDPCGPGAKHCSQGPQKSPGLKTFSEWPSDTTNVIILETSNLIIRSASEFCLNTTCQDAQESTFLNNPFFKLRSRSSHSLVDREIKIVKKREEELKQQRAHLYPKEKYDTVLVSPNLMESINFDKSELPVRCKSSPSSPLRAARKMDRSVVSCDHKFTDTFSVVRRKSAMAMRWEAGEFANHQQE